MDYQQYERQPQNRHGGKREANRRRAKRARRIFAALFLLSMMTVLAVKSAPAFTQVINSLLGGSATASDFAPAPQPPGFDDSSLYSSNAILLHLHDRAVLLDKHSEERIYPASLTKIMTAIVSIENLPDLDKAVPLPERLFDDLYAANASMAGFQPGDEVPAIDLLYGLMLPSGAECSAGLAEEIAGSEEAFVQLMNEKADELGMADTHFVNASGLHDKNHYSTARDIAVLLSYALEDDTFRDIFTSPRHSTKATRLNPDGITFYSTLFDKLESTLLSDGEILGGKTGYTDQAGLCLASLSEQGGAEYILVTAGAAGDHTTEPFHILDLFQVFDMRASAWK